MVDYISKIFIDIINVDIIKINKTNYLDSFIGGENVRSK